MSKRNAFTLVELLVVIAILALLVSILSPSLRRAHELGLVGVCSSNLHQIHTGFVEYSTDHDLSLFVAPSSNPNYVHNSFWSWGGLTMDYDYSYLGAPWNKATHPYNRGINPYLTERSTAYLCPGDPPGDTIIFPPMAGRSTQAYYSTAGASYQYNAFLVGPTSVNLGTAHPAYSKFSQVKHTGRTWLANEWPAYDVCWPFYRPAWWTSMPRWSFHDANALPFNAEGNTGNNTVFFDGHAEYIRYAEGVWDGEDYSLSDR